MNTVTCLVILVIIVARSSIVLQTHCKSAALPRLTDYEDTRAGCWRLHLAPYRGILELVIKFLARMQAVQITNFDRLGQWYCRFSHSGEVPSTSPIIISIIGLDSPKDRDLVSGEGIRPCRLFSKGACCTLAAASFPKEGTVNILRSD